MHYFFFCLLRAKRFSLAVPVSSFRSSSLRHVSVCPVRMSIGQCETECERIGKKQRKEMVARQKCTAIPQWKEGIKLMHVFCFSFLIFDYLNVTNNRPIQWRSAGPSTSSCCWRSLVGLNAKRAHAHTCIDTKRERSSKKKTRTSSQSTARENVGAFRNGNWSNRMFSACAAQDKRTACIDCAKAKKKWREASVRWGKRQKKTRWKKGNSNGNGINENANEKKKNCFHLFSVSKVEMKCQWVISSRSLQTAYAHMRWDANAQRERPTVERERERESFMIQNTSLSIKILKMEF